MRKIGLTLVLLVLSFGNSWGCECIFETKQTFEERLEGYSFIFYAEVVTIEDSKNPVFELLTEYQNDSLYDRKFGYEARFQIIEVLKGDLSTAISEDHFFLKSEFSLCSATFKLGEKYLIYAYQDDPQKIRITTCNPGIIFETEIDYQNHRQAIKKALRQKES